MCFQGDAHVAAIAETGARLATPGVKIGLFCAMPMLSRVIGRRRAMEMLLTGRFVEAAEAERFGLVNRVVTPKALAEETETWASEIARSSPFAIGFGKKLFYRQIDLNEASAYAIAREGMVLDSMTDDAREGIRAFLEKPPPKWR